MAHFLKNPKDEHLTLVTISTHLADRRMMGINKLIRSLSDIKPNFLHREIHNYWKGESLVRY